MGFFDFLKQPDSNRFKTEKDIKQLTKALKNTDDAKFNLAINALLELNDARSISSLIEIFEQLIKDSLNQKSEFTDHRRFNDPYTKRRLLIIDAIGKIGNSAAVDYFLDVLSNEKEPSIQGRLKIIETLGVIGDTRAVESILNVLCHKKDFLNKAMTALVNIGGPDVINALIRALKYSVDTNNGQLRISIFRELSKMGSSVEGPLEALLNSALERKDMAYADEALTLLTHMRKKSTQ